MILSLFYSYLSLHFLTPTSLSTLSIFNIFSPIFTPLSLSLSLFHSNFISIYLLLSFSSVYSILSTSLYFISIFLLLLSPYTSVLFYFFVALYFLSLLSTFSPYFHSLLSHRSFYVTLVRYFGTTLLSHFHSLPVSIVTPNAISNPMSNCGKFLNHR